jgi:hypothetical protein
LGQGYLCLELLKISMSQIFWDNTLQMIRQYCGAFTSHRDQWLSLAFSAANAGPDEGFSMRAIARGFGLVCLWSALTNLSAVGAGCSQAARNDI